MAQKILFIVLCHFLISLCSLSTVVLSSRYLDDLEKVGFAINWRCASDKLNNVNYQKVLADLANCEYSTNVQVVELSKIEARNEYIGTFCRNPYAKVCASVVAVSLGPCLSNDQRTYLHHKEASYIAEKNYACQMNGKPIIDFVMARGQVCLVHNSDEINKCNRRFTWSDDVERYYSAESCRNRKERIKCIANVAKSCNSEVMYSYFMGSNDALLTPTPCKSLYIPVYGTTLQPKLFSTPQSKHYTTPKQKHGSAPKRKPGCASRESPMYYLIATLLLCIIHQMWQF